MASHQLRESSDFNPVSYLTKSSKGSNNFESKSNATAVDKMKSTPEGECNHFPSPSSKMPAHTALEKTTNPHLATLSTELKLQIMNNLDKVSSTCLGVTCKTFYNLYLEKHGVVRLSSGGNKFVRNGKMLANYLAKWVLEISSIITTKLIAKWMKEEEENALEEARYSWYGLDRGDYQEIADSYMRAVAEKGFKYQKRPDIEDFIDEHHLDKIDRFERACDMLEMDPDIAQGLDMDFFQAGMEMVGSDCED
ncbi:hypothetical protein N431DRAFT_444971 [Stipitochalara longipes BDJ]|nr:hypothetical protein N431DRAFT_444971 [Stipitochalara longipes BDJ]